MPWGSRPFGGGAWGSSAGNPPATASGTFTFTGTAVGVPKVTATGTGSFTFTGIATGSLPLPTASGSFVFVGEASGVATAPSLTALELYASLAPLMDRDAEYGSPGLVFCMARARLFDPVATLVRDQADGTPGWAIVFQPDNPDLDPAWLPWIAQFIGDGAAVQAASTTEDKINLVKNPTNFTLGLPATIRRTVAQFLTGTQTVYYNSAYGGNPFVLKIATFTSETPANTTAMQAAVLAVCPAWLDVIFTTVAAATYEQLDSAHATYQELEAAHTDYADLEQNPGA